MTYVIEFQNDKRSLLVTIKSENGTCTKHCFTEYEACAFVGKLSQLQNDILNAAKYLPKEKV